MWGHIVPPTLLAVVSNLDVDHRKSQSDKLLRRGTVINVKQNVGELSAGKDKLTRKDSGAGLPTSTETTKRVRRGSQTPAPKTNGWVVPRVFSRPGVKPFDEIEWDRR